jgi:hypothetical protein
MTQAYLTHQGLEEFAAAREQFSHECGSFWTTFAPSRRLLQRERLVA